MTLEPITRTRAVDLNPTLREPKIAQATYYSHQSRLDHFVRWCEQNDITNCNDLTGRELFEYRVWRRNGVHTQLAFE